MQDVKDPRKYLYAFADFVAMLMWRPCTAAELMALTGCCGKQAYRKLNALHQAGVVRVIGRRGNVTRGLPPKVYAMQPTPYALEDTPEITLPAPEA